MLSLNGLWELEFINLFKSWSVEESNLLIFTNRNIELFVQLKFFVFANLE